MPEKRGASFQACVEAIASTLEETLLFKCGESLFCQKEDTCVHAQWHFPLIVSHLFKEMGMPKDGKVIFNG